MNKKLVNKLRRLVSKNNVLKVKILEHGKGLPLIKHHTPGSAGLDLYAAEDIIVKKFSARFKGHQVFVKTGVCVEIPSGYFGQIFSRSSVAVGNMVDTVAGTIDNDYRGEVSVCLRNYNSKSFEIKRGNRIAQLILIPYAKVNVLEVEELSKTSRNTGALGSTGK